MKITSVNNETVKEMTKLLQKKYREETGLFLIEGEKGLSEALNYGIELNKIFYSEEKYLPEKISDKVELYEVTEPILSKISDTKSAPKVIAVAKQLKTNLAELKNSKKVVLLEGIKDSGNLGTILRTSVAFNCDAVILYGDTIDIYNPKCVRASVGNLWKIPVFQINDFQILNKYFKDFERIATLPKGKNVIDLKEYKPKEKTLVMFGSEADGLSSELKSFATTNLTIEMSKNVESLNLAISAGIIMYKLS